MKTCRKKGLPGAKTSGIFRPFCSRQELQEAAIRETLVSSRGHAVGFRSEARRRPCQELSGSGRGGGRRLGEGPQKALVMCLWLAACSTLAD